MQYILIGELISTDLYLKEYRLDLYIKQFVSMKNKSKF